MKNAEKQLQHQDVLNDLNTVEKKNKNPDHSYFSTVCSIIL